MSATDEGRIHRATATMSVGTALSRLTGLARTAAMTYALGVTATRLADTYNLANTTPNILYELVLGGVFTSVFVPVLVGMRARDEDSSPLVSASLVLLAVASVLVAAGAPVIVRAYTWNIPDPAVREAQQALATDLLRWFSPQIFFYGLGAIAAAMLNARRRFGPPMFTPILNNLVWGGTFLVYASAFGERGLELTTGAKVLLGAGTTAGVAVQALALLPFLRGERLRFRPRFTDPAVAAVIRLAGYTVAYVALNQIGLWVALALANRVRGGVTAYQAAFTFFQLPHGLFAVSVVTAVLPDMSSAAASEDWDAYRARFGIAVRTVAYLLLPAVVGYLLIADPLTGLLLAHGAAGPRDAEIVASVLRAFTVGLPFFSLFQLLTRSFYALRDTRTPTVLNAIAVVVNIAANVALFPRFGVTGLAAGHALSYAVGSALLAAALRRRVGRLGLRDLTAPVAKMTAAALAMGAALWFLRTSVPLGDGGTVAVAAGVGAILYLAFSQVMGIPERRIIVGLARREAHVDAEEAGLGSEDAGGKEV